MASRERTESGPGDSLPEVYRQLAETGLVRRLFELARDEDLGPALLDRSASVCGSDSTRARARIIMGEQARVAGLEAIPEMIEAFASAVRFEPKSADGLVAPAGTCIGDLIGPVGSIVTIERPILNLLGRLSGIASRTARFVERAGPGVAVLDTRKTTPGLRVLEKYAVRCGGGASHRIGLFDAVMLKDNHIAGVPIERLTEWLNTMLSKPEARSASFVEVEVDTLEQFAEVLAVEAGLIEYVLLDNMNTERLRRAVAMRDESGSSIRLEASGGVTMETIGPIAATGVERISIGGLTHHAVSVDVRLDIAGVL